MGLKEILFHFEIFSLQFRLIFSVLETKGIYIKLPHSKNSVDEEGMPTGKHMKAS
jgi:hypothetical protein